jgi:hypothetical protein
MPKTPSLSQLMEPPDTPGGFSPWTVSALPSAPEGGTEPAPATRGQKNAPSIPLHPTQNPSRCEHCRGDRRHSAARAVQVSIGERSEESIELVRGDLRASAQAFCARIRMLFGLQCLRSKAFASSFLIA